MKLGVVVELSLLVEGQEMLDILFQPQSSNKKYDSDMVYVLYIYTVYIYDYCTIFLLLQNNLY